MSPTVSTLPRLSESAPAETKHRTALSRADWLALGVLVAVPIFLYVPLAIAGHLPLEGDNFTQNYPLRVLSGEFLRHGRLPLFDQSIWSGAPLLAGWNAGSLFPGTWLFAVLPSVSAWTINAAGALVVAGVALFVFLRRIGCSSLAALLGALAFSETGFMAGQIPHLGLIQGMALAPVMLIALDGLQREISPPEPTRRSGSAVLAWVVLLAVAAALCVLAGDPRAVSNDAVIVIGYVIACCWRARRVRTIAVLLAALAGSAVLAVLLSAPQWLPGLAFLHSSQRGVTSLAYFRAGSLTVHAVPLLFLPFGLGGYGNLGEPMYASGYNLPEVTFALGTLALVALVALVLPRLRRLSPAPLGVWFGLFLFGIVLTTGPSTPLVHLLVRIPLYSGERLQNRNIAISDLALAVLLAVFVDAASRRFSAGREVREKVPESARQTGVGSGAGAGAWAGAMAPGLSLLERVLLLV
ncbi:MAG: hypothetical protein ACRDZP_06085, partial [Acidimicrobiales bacterium]